MVRFPASAKHFYLISQADVREVLDIVRSQIVEAKTQLINHHAQQAVGETERTPQSQGGIQCVLEGMLAIREDRVS